MEENWHQNQLLFSKRQFRTLPVGVFEHDKKPFLKNGKLKNPIKIVLQTVWH
jgi:hypothetical protein